MDNLQTAEQQPNKSVEFMESLGRAGGMYIGAQAYIDSIDLWISSVKYYFDSINPASNSMSSEMFNAWLHSEEGLIIFFTGQFALGLFAFLANGISKENQTSISKFADTYWPYVRDVIKRLKWVFKGTRSLVIVSQNLFNANFVAYITPLGIGLGVIGALNQLWNRSMVEERKSLQENNNLFRRQVKSIGACYAEIDNELIYDNNELRNDVLKNIYANSILKVKNAQNEYQYLHIDANGKSSEIESNLFLDKLSAAADKQTNKRLSVFEYKQLIDSIESPENDLLVQIYQDKLNYIKNHILQEESEQRNFLKGQAKFQNSFMQAYASATLSGILNAPYYFLGVLSMVTLPAIFFPYAVGLCSFFMALNVLSEVYQESDYQRRLNLSKLKAEMVMNKRLLVMEWLSLNELYPESEKLKELVVNNHEDLLPSLQRIKNLEALISDNHKEIEPLLRLPMLNVCWQAIRNGLVVYGAFNSLLMSVATMSFLFGISLTPAFFYVSIAVGLIMLALVTAYTLCFINPNPVAEPGEETNEQNDSKFVSDETKALLDKSINESQNLLIPEHAEVFRQALSGIKKSIKIVQTIFSADVINPVAIAAYTLAAITYGFLFALKGLRGLMRVDNEGYKQSYMYITITGEVPEEVQHEVAPSARWFR